MDTRGDSKPGHKRRRQTVTVPELQRTLGRWEEQIRKYIYSEKRKGRDRSSPDSLRLQTTTNGVVIAEMKASPALEGVDAMLGGEVDQEALKVVEELWTEWSTTITEAHRALTADIMQDGGRSQ